MSNYFSSILFQMFKWFSFFFLFIAILVCPTWFLKKLRLCRRATTTLARCNFVLFFEGACLSSLQMAVKMSSNKPGAADSHLDYIDASLLGNNISSMIYGTVALEC